MVQSVNQRISADWRPVGGASLRVADGSRLAVAGIDDLMDEPWFSEVRWVVETPGFGGTAPVDIRMVQTGPVGTVDRLVVGLLQGDYVAEYSSQGGTIVLATRTAGEGSQGLVAWRGRWHEAYAWVNVPDAPHSVYLDALAGLAFTDTPEGLLVRLTQRSARFDRLTVTKHVPGTGLLSFVQPAHAPGQVPAWKGARVRSGEVWRQSLPEEAVGAGAAVLVHLSSDAVTVLHPQVPTDPAPGLEVLERISSISWA